MKNLITICIVAGVLFLASGTSFAVLTTVFSQDLLEQDPLLVPQVVHELGTGADFPQDELILATDTITDLIACPEFPFDNPNIPNALVRMTNLTGIDWAEVWYVADGIDPFFPIETALTNYDGLVNDALAFKIDFVGVNKPLVFESMVADGIFQAGETWEFIIQDYENALGLAPSALGSVGVPSPSLAFPEFASSGSIIAVAVPEPATMTLLGLGGVVAMLKRRRKF